MVYGGERVSERVLLTLYGWWSLGLAFNREATEEAKLNTTGAEAVATASQQQSVWKVSLDLLHYSTAV